MHKPAHGGAVIEPLLSVNQVCDMLGVTRSTVYKLVREQEIVPTFVGARARFEAGELRDFVRRNRRER